MALSTYGQFSENADFSFCRSANTSGSWAFDNDALVTPEVASFFIRVRACTVLSSMVGAVLSLLTSVPPYADTRLLMLTTYPSYWAAVMPISWILPWALSCWAIEIISSYVLGGVGTSDLRYHMSWTLVVRGTP